MNYIEMPIEQALVRKWVAGRIDRSLLDASSVKFEGDPLAELFEEMLDGINYAEEAERQGLIERETKIRWVACFREVAEKCQALAGVATGQG